MNWVVNWVVYPKSACNFQSAVAYTVDARRYSTHNVSVG